MAHRSLRIGLGLLLSVATVSAGAVAITAQGAAAATASPYQLLVEPTAGMGQIDSLIQSAKSSIDMTIYELSDQTLEGDLATAAANGVSVRVILDRAYHGGAVNQAAYSYLSSHGVPVHWASTSVIFHEKAFTIDGSVAAIGTGNLTPNYYSSDRDYWLVDSNPADVAAVDSTFTADWAGGSPDSGSPGADLVWSPGSASALVGLISSAKHSVDFESEELSDPAVIDALAADARRGVACEVLMENTSEWAAAFATLTQAGCKVRTYPESGSPYIHAKAILVDAATPTARLFVGSENASPTSLTADRELGVILNSSQASAVLAKVTSVFSADFNGATEAAALSTWAAHDKATAAALARIARSYQKHPTTQKCQALVSVLKKSKQPKKTRKSQKSQKSNGFGVGGVIEAKKQSTPTPVASKWRTATKNLNAASATCPGQRSQPSKATTLHVRLGLVGLASLARVLIHHHVRFGRTLLLFTGLAIGRHQKGHHHRSPSPKATTPPTTAAPPPPTTIPPPPTTTEPPPPPPTSPPTTVAPTGCYPLSDEDQCYRPGEYCRNATVGITGVAETGEPIVCTTDNGTPHWEPK